MLNPHEDAYGQMIWDQFHGKRPVEIVERDDGRIDASGDRRRTSPSSQTGRHTSAGP